MTMVAGRFLGSLYCSGNSKSLDSFRHQVELWGAMTAAGRVS